MAISTNNEEYIYARKRADETLRRSFHSASASASSASAAASSASVSSSSSARARGHGHGHGQAGAVEQDDFKFLSPALCSVSADFFTQYRHQKESRSGTGSGTGTISGTTAESSHGYREMKGYAAASSAGVSASTSASASSTASVSNNNSSNNGSSSDNGSNVPHVRDPSTFMTTNPILRSRTLRNSMNLTDSVHQRLEQIYQDYNITGNIRSLTIPHGATIRRYPVSSSKRSKKDTMDSDITETVLQLTNLIFQSGKDDCKNKNKDANKNSESSKEQFHKFGASLPKKVCQHPFKRNDIVWVCRTCQADETCVLCHSCFNASDHTGHDVAFYHAQAGGCCDCGDPDAWDPKGFCPLHGKDVDVTLESGLENRVRGAVDLCVEYLTEFAESVEKGYKRANVGVGLRSGKRKFGRSHSTNDAVEGSSNGDVEGMDVGGNDAVGDESLDSSNSEFDDYTDAVRSPARRNVQRSNTISMDFSDYSVERVQSSTEAMDISSRSAAEAMDVENDAVNMAGASSLASTSNHVARLPTPETPERSADDTDECKFDPTAAGTSKSRSLNSSSHHSSESESIKSEQEKKSEEFDPEAASTSKSQIRAKRRVSASQSMTPSQHLGLLGSQQEGLFLLLHADDVHKKSDVSNALRSLYLSYPHHIVGHLDTMTSKIAYLFERGIGDLIVWGTKELMDELGPVLSSCWRDQDATACTRFGALMLEKAKILTKIGMVVSIKTRLELCREMRCAAVLNFLNLMGSSCDPFCRLVSVGLGAKEDLKSKGANGDVCRIIDSTVAPGAEQETKLAVANDDVRMRDEQVQVSNFDGGTGSSRQLIAMLRSDLKLPRQVAKSWHELLLTLLAVPNFKAVLANAYIDTYGSVTAQYAHGIGIFDKSTYTLSVQFLNRVTYVEDLVRERDLLGCLVRSLLQTLAVAQKANGASVDVSIPVAATTASATWTINMIHDVIEDYLNPHGPRMPWNGRRLRTEQKIDTGWETPTRLNPVLDPMQSVLDCRRYQPCVGDLKCVLNVPGVARLFSSIPKSKMNQSTETTQMPQKPCLLDAWIDTLSLAQNMDGQRWRREKDGHVEQEPRDWVSAFNAGIAIGSLFERILNWDDDDVDVDNNLTKDLQNFNKYFTILELTEYVLTKGVDLWQCCEALRFKPTNGAIPEYNAPTCLPMSSVAVDNNSHVAMKALSVAQSHLWSFHLPLHRFIASCVREVSRRPYETTDGDAAGIQKLLISLKENINAEKLFRIYSGLLEFPAIILSRNSQIRSCLWQRNGRGMLDQVLNYAEPHFCKGLRDADLSLVQFAFIGLLSLKQADLDTAAEGERSKHTSFSSAQFVNLLLHRFGIFEFAGFSNAAEVYEDRYWQEVREGLYPAEKQISSEKKTLPWSYCATSDPPRKKVLLEEFLHTLIILITELFAPPPKDSSQCTSQAKARLRREVVHRLASGPKTHSELAEVHHVLSMRDNTVLSREGKLVNPDDATGAALEAALVEVADCKSVQGKSDTWVLQRWGWNEYDPAFFHLSLRQHQNASEMRPNGDSKDRKITPIPYAPYPPAAHIFFRRLRRDITSDSCIIAIVYRSLHVHCYDTDGNEPLKNYFGNNEAYLSEAMSETILGRVIHLLTLGVYAWEDTAQSSDSWFEDGGGEEGSVFSKFSSKPTQKDWVERILLGKPDEIMSSKIYATEPNALQLLDKLVTAGGSEHFKVQDKSIRCGAAWLCDYAARHSLVAAEIIGNKKNASKSRGANHALESDKERRSREAKERAMKAMKEQMAKFANTLESDNGNEVHDKIPVHPDVVPPRSPSDSDSGSMIIDVVDVESSSTPKTIDTRTDLVDSGNTGAAFSPSLCTLVGKEEVHSAPRLLHERLRCIICDDDGVMMRDTTSGDSNDEFMDKPKKKVLTLCGYIQASTVVRGGGGIPSMDIDESTHLVGTHISLCGHAVHSSCIESQLKDTEYHRLMDRHETGKRSDFKCPMCRRQSNCLVPFIDVGKGWAFDNKNERKCHKSFPEPLHDFLERSKWWAARNDCLFVWNGRCSFVPKDVSCEDEADIDQEPLIKSFGKKDLCRAWSTVLWTHPNIPRGSSDLIENTNERKAVLSSCSTEVSVVWRRLLDQGSEISFKADSKRIGEDNLQRNLGEFRHYLVEKVAYNEENLSTDLMESTDWPSCMCPNPTHEKRQALSREKLMSKHFLSIQTLTYSCCAELAECTRLVRNSTSANLEHLYKQFGVKRFVCNGNFAILPTPSIGDGTQLFEGKIGRLRFYALAVVVATSPMAREVVHLCMNLPVPRKNIINIDDESSSMKRSQIVHPILCGHVLTHVTAALCATCGQERARSEAMGTAQSFMTLLLPDLGEEAGQSTVQDCLYFIQLGFLARNLQVLLGSLQRAGTSDDLNTFECNMLTLITQVLSAESVSPWEKSCALLLHAALSRRFSTSVGNETGENIQQNLELFSKACRMAKACSKDFILDVGFILQVLLPKSVYLFEKVEGSQKESEEEFYNLLRIFGIQSLDSLIHSPLVTEVLGYWYEQARPIEHLTGLAARLDCKRVFRTYDWPHLHTSNNVDPTRRVQEVLIKSVPLLQGSILVDDPIGDRINYIKSLPMSYTDLYANLGPMLPDTELIAVCFVCGEVLDAGGKGECTKHAHKCGAGCGIFFLLQECVCIIVHKENAAYITSPYVDSHGETPQYRGRPLNMDLSRYEFLHELWSGHHLREHVIAERSKSSRNLLIVSSYF